MATILNFDDGAVKVLERLKSATQKSSGDVLQDALSLYEWARIQNSKGLRVGSIDSKGNGVNEVILFPLAKR
jgi:hypothetical protein